MLLLQVVSIPRSLRTFTASFLILCLFGVAVVGHRFRRPSSIVSSTPYPLNFEAAGNETLGFQKIIFLNLPYRYDFSDAMTMQSELAGLQWDVEDSVLADSIDERRSGYPPSSNDYGSLPADRGRLGQWACTRSHANVWKLMLKEGLETALILEGDATFSVDIRNQSKQLASALNNLSIHQDLGLNASNSHPWGTHNWDTVFFGACSEGNDFSDIFEVYEDPGTPSISYDYSSVDSFHTKVNQRIIRKSGSPACTGAYAISRRGAKRMLLRQAVDFDRPVDWMIDDEIENGRITSFTVLPPLIPQWSYKDGLGGTFGGSDIDVNQEEANYDKSVWQEAHEKWNVWNVKFYGPIPKWALAEVGKLWTHGISHKQ